MGTRRGQDPRSRRGKRRKLLWGEMAGAKAMELSCRCLWDMPEVRFTQWDVELRPPEGAGDFTCSF